MSMAGMATQRPERAYQDARVCITGATGFVGGHLARRLLDEGADLTLLVRDRTRLAPKLAARCRVVEADMTDPSAVRQAMSNAVHHAEYVFHCAANVATWDRWEAYYAANVQGVSNLLDALAGHAAGLRRLVHLSTVDVHGFPDLPADDALSCLHVPFGYGESKRQGEVLLAEQCARQGLPYTIIRPCNIVGPGSPFVMRIGEALRSGLMLTVDGGRAHAGLIDIENLLDILLWAGKEDAAQGQAFNARDPHDISWADYLSDLRTGLKGRGVILNFSYATAMRLARMMSGLHQALRLPGEPMLHPLIVQIFGKTCGHAIQGLQQASVPLGRIAYAQSLQRSIDWFHELHSRSAD